jgi:hypothetical protein
MMQTRHKLALRWFDGQVSRHVARRRSEYFYAADDMGTGLQQTLTLHE